MKLADKNIHRLGNVLVPMDSYGPLIEEKMQAFLEEEYQNGVKEMTTSEICKMIGKHLGEDSFLYWAYKNNIRCCSSRNYGWCSWESNLVIHTKT